MADFHCVYACAEFPSCGCYARGRNPPKLDTCYKCIREDYCRAQAECHYTGSPLLNPDGTPRRRPPIDNPDAARLLPVSQAIMDMDDGAAGMFVLHMDTFPTKAATECINYMWKTQWEIAGYDPPGLLIVPRGMQLSVLRGAELRDAGLMRIPAGETDHG